jgi:hypothetical protein
MRRCCVGSKEQGPGGGQGVLSRGPRKRNGHEVGGKFLFANLKLFVSGFACNVGEGPVWHLGLDGLGRDSV